MITRRTEILRKKLRETKPSICIDRARLVTKFYSSCRTESIVITKAKLFKYILENMSIYIAPYELLAGNHASKFRSVPVFPELGVRWMLRELDTFETRTTDALHMETEDKKELEQILKIWDGKSVNEIVNSKISAKAILAEKCGVLSVGSRNTSTGHVVPNYKHLMQVGFKGIIQEAEQKIAEIKMRNNINQHNIDVWEGMIITSKAAIAFANRYADLAESMSEKTNDENRKRELKQISYNCRYVPENPPATFYQGIQFLWFVHLLIQIETNGHSISLGRFDQYMYDLYKTDKEKNNITDEECVEIIQSLWLKITEIIKIRDAFDSQAFAGYPMWQNVTIGGQTIEGKDACNELTYLVLEATEGIQTTQPSVSYRYHKKQDVDIFKKAISLVQQGLATPAFFNDDLVIPLVLAKGATVKEARDWSILGCVEPYVGGKTDGRPVVGYINSVKLVELVCNNGYDPVNKIQIGPKTGDPCKFKTMKEFEDAYKKQMEYFTEMMVTNYNIVTSIHAQIMPMVFSSTLVDGCIEKGMILQEGGAKYNFSGSFITALANAADSLMAIDKVVFQNKQITMKQLLEVMTCDYEGQERIRQLMLNAPKKYGNDYDEVDEYARKVVDCMVGNLEKYRDSRNAKYILSILSQSFNVLQGKSVGATPDGRHAYTPLANNASPVAGNDINGPTAVVKSISKIDQMRPLNGTLLNQRFDPVFVKGEKGMAILSSVIKTYFDEKGEHIQINVVDEKTLRDAQINPENHRNLMVRVAGYSAYFIELDKEVQEDVIRRTTQTRL